MPLGSFTKRFKLSKLDFDEISLVPAGDNPPAKVVIAKADKTQEHEGASRTLIDNEHGGGTMPFTQDDNIISKADLPQEVVDYIESVEDALEEALETIQQQPETTGLNVGTVTVTDGSQGGDYVVVEELDEEAVLAKADPGVRYLIEKAEQRAQEAEDIAKAEREQRVQREYISKAEPMSQHLTISTDELAEVMKSVAEVDPTLGEKVERVLRAAATQVEKSGLFAEVGTSTAPTLAPGAEAKAEEIRKADPKLTREQAIAKAYEENPDLYFEHSQEG